jgi:hypothetical protein
MRRDREVPGSVVEVENWIEPASFEELGEVERSLPILRPEAEQRGEVLWLFHRALAV